MIGYLSGVLSIAWIPSLYYGWWLLAALLLALILSFLLSSTLRFVVLAMFLGALWAQLFGTVSIAYRLPLDHGKLEVSLQGGVTNLQPNRAIGYQSLDITLTDSIPSSPLIRNVRLGLYDSDLIVKAGDQIRVLAKIVAPHSVRNESSPDRSLRDLRNRIDATGYIKTVEWVQPNTAIRQRVFDWIQTRFSDSTSAVMAALVLGDRQLLNQKQWDLLRVSGTVHLAVVSGLHLGVMTLGGLFIGRALVIAIGYLTGRPVYSLTRCLPPIIALGLATFYLYFGGAGLPLQRAWIMATCLVGGMLFDRRPSATQRLKLAAVIVTLVDPLAIIDLGFWLSFGLVLALLLLNRWRCRLTMGWRLLTVQLFITTVMMPVIASGTGNINLGGALANLWAIPYVSLSVALFPITLPLSWLFSEMAWLFDRWSDLFWLGLSVHDSVKLQGRWPAVSHWTVLSAVLGILLLWLPLHLRWLGLLFCLPMLAMGPSYNDPGRFEVRVLDVGQGQSIIIQTDGNTLVYDLGARSRSGWMVAHTTLIPTLKDHAVDRVDLITSHSDIDHVGGLNALKESVMIDRWYSGQPDITGGDQCSHTLWKSNNVNFEIFSLPNASNDNDQSCVLHIDNEVCSLLIAGDLSANAEAELLQRFDIEPLTWLVLSHHGSQSSTSGYWLDRLSPKAAIVSRGRFNRFNHPSDAVVNRVTARDIPLFDTAYEGEIYLTASLSGCDVNTFHALFKRYWHDTD